MVSCHAKETESSQIWAWYCAIRPQYLLTISLRCASQYGSIFFDKVIEPYPKQTCTIADKTPCLWNEYPRWTSASKTILDI